MIPYSSNVLRSLWAGGKKPDKNKWFYWAYNFIFSGAVVAANTGVLHLQELFFRVSSQISEANSGWQKVKNYHKSTPRSSPLGFFQQLVYSRACWKLTPALVNLEQVSDSRPVPSDASVHLWILRGRGVSSVLTPSSPLAWILTLPTPLSISCPSNLPLPPIHSRALQDTFPSQPEKRVMCCVIFHYLCLSPFFSPLTVDSHCITAACYRTGSDCKGSASIRVPIIIPNQSHFSI